MPERKHSFFRRCSLIHDGKTSEMGGLDLKKWYQLQPIKTTLIDHKDIFKYKVCVIPKRCHHWRLCCAGGVTLAASTVTVCPTTTQCDTLHSVPHHHTATVPHCFTLPHCIHTPHCTCVYPCKRSPSLVCSLLGSGALVPFKSLCFTLGNTS